jgi:transposase
MTDKERKLIFKIFSELHADWTEYPDKRMGPLHEYVAKLVGRAASTVELVVKEQGHHAQAASQVKQGFIDTEHITTIRSYLEESLRNGKPTSCSTVDKLLRESHGIVISRPTLRRVIRGMGFRWAKGERRNIAVLKSQNVLFCASFCEALLQSRPHNIPERPEIYLDESYCYENITTGYTWTFKNIPFHHRSRGKKVVIVGAGVVLANGAGELMGEWVPDSLQMWDPNVKSKPSGVRPFLADYHGNMNAANFEAWLDRMCQTARNVYGPTVIYLDGCSSHKRVQDPAPTTSWKKEAIITWLRAKGENVESIKTKVELLQAVKRLKLPARYATRTIAERYGHELRFLPPYHPELNIIEKVWAVAKGAVARETPQTHEQFQKCLDTAFNDTVTSHTWVASWTKALEYARGYANNVEADGEGHVGAEVESSEESGDTDESDADVYETACESD